MLTGKLTQKEIALLKASTKQKKPLNGRQLFEQSEAQEEFLQRELPKAREEFRRAIGVEKLTTQQRFGVRSTLNTQRWNALSEEEKAEWSRKAKEHAQSGAVPQSP